MVKKLISDGAYLIHIDTPFNVFLTYFIKVNENIKLKKIYAIYSLNFADTIKTLKLSNDWFSKNVPFWLSIIEQYGLRNKQIRALEIGSWEGLSSYFILSQMPLAHLTCVDTWKGADEHRDENVVPSDLVAHIEDAFDKNLYIFRSRLTKYRGSSFSFFNNEDSVRCKFDFIYIDGSHYCDDVIIDAIKSFEILKVGGVMIFDDYLWRYYKAKKENPASAINLFLRLKKGQYKIIRLYYQLVIIKTSDRHAQF
jgi:hypothetical protein